MARRLSPYKKEKGRKLAERIAEGYRIEGFEVSIEENVNPTELGENAHIYIIYVEGEAPTYVLA